MLIQTTQLTPQLTPRQLQLLKAIAASQTARCCSPTIAELARRLNISRSTVFEHITELRKKSLLSDYSGRARSLKLTSKSQELLNQLDNHHTDFPALPQDIPLLGRVAAGLPVEAVENKEQLSLVSCFGNSDNIFALEVKGDSMIDDDIRSGDYIICRRVSSAETGQLVIAIVDDGSATLKRFYKEETAVRLQPANDNYSPIYSNNCRIEAVVIGLIRKF